MPLVPFSKTISIFVKSVTYKSRLDLFDKLVEMEIA
jgi:hypothetical protein